MTLFAKPSDAYMQSIAAANAISNFFSTVPGSDSVADLGGIAFNPLRPQCVFLAAYDYLCAYLAEQDGDVGSDDIPFPDGYFAAESFEDCSLVELMGHVDDHISSSLGIMESCFSTFAGAFSFSEQDVSAFNEQGWRLVSTDNVFDIELVSDSPLASVADAWCAIIDGAMGGDDSLRTVLGLLQTNKAKYELYVDDVLVVDFESDEGWSGWVVIFQNNRIVHFDSVDSARQYQRLYRSTVGLDQVTGLPV